MIIHKDTLKVFYDLKNKKESVWSNVIWYVKVCIFWKYIRHTIHCDKSQMLENIPSDKINGAKMPFFFLSQAPTYHSFTFNLWFLHEQKHKVRLSKTVRGIFHFWFSFIFSKVYIFVQQNAWTLRCQNIIIPFKVKITKKSHTVLFLEVWFLSCNKKF